MSKESDEFVEGGPLHQEIHRAFKDGTVFAVPDERLDKYLSWIASELFTNDALKHVQIVRGITINTIKMDRYIRKATRQSTFHTYIILMLAALAIAVSLWSVHLSSKQSNEAAQQIDRLIALQAEQVQLLKEQRQ
jgi:hypothetical protein